MKTMIILLAIMVIPCIAKDKPKILIKVVGSETRERQVAYTVPGTASQSKTSCTGSNGTGPLATSQADCTTTTTPGSPAQRQTTTVPYEIVKAIMPDGRHILITCVPGLTNRCASSTAEGSYEAQIDSNTVTVYGHDLGGKVHKIKYRAIGTWKE